MKLKTVKAIFNGLVAVMLALAAGYALTDSFLLGCGVIVLGIAASVFHFALYRCPHCGKHLGRGTPDACPHSGKPPEDAPDPTGPSCKA